MNISLKFPSVAVSMMMVGVCVTSVRSQTVVESGHADIGFAYENSEWRLSVSNKVSNVQYAPNTVVLRLNSAFAQSVPSGPAYAFLGAAGSAYYVVPQTQAAGRLFLGLSAEAIPHNTFEGEVINVYLRSISGPGSFALYTIDGSGNPIVHMNSADGLTSADSYDLAAEGHAHYNWAFSKPGNYTLGFEATGFHLGEGQVTSPVVSFGFEVVPEPSTWSLLGAGGVFLVGLRKRRARE